jgi:hypothetical protein
MLRSCLAIHLLYPFTLSHQNWLSVLLFRWRISHLLATKQFCYGEDPSKKTPDIRSFCHKCDEKEPYNYINGTDILVEFPNKNPTTQTYALSYECQGCKDTHEIFLVHREGMKLTISGRSPIEEIIIAPQIPKSHKKYMSDAILASNTGQILAGIFLLRTFIEQYVRSKNTTPNTDDIELLFKDYAITLPDDFKSRFPSLKSIYDTLSVALHLANPSDEVYLKAKEGIEYHFEGKKTFRIN